MPDPALPVNRVEMHHKHACTYRQTFRDALGRPLAGKVTITGTTRHESNGLVILPVPVVAQLEGGVLNVRLPPDTYQVEADLRTREGAVVSDAFQITL